MIAIGVSVTELTATITSFNKESVQMAEFGFSLVVGGLAFATSMIPAVAYLLNYGCCKKRPQHP
jgi:hypothetical protein